MQWLARMARSLGGCCLGGVAALAAFGLALGLLTLPRFAARPAFELAAAITAGALGFVAGGFAAGWTAGGMRALHGGLLGLSLGLFGFSYLLGPGWPALLSGLAAAGLAAAGGWAADRWCSSGSASQTG